MNNVKIYTKKRAETPDFTGFSAYMSFVIRAAGDYNKAIGQTKSKSNQQQI